MRHRNIKMWRTRLRPLIYSFTLFGLGVTTCLMFVQMSQNYDIDGPAVYTNREEYQPRHQQLLQTQQEAPCGNVDINNLIEDRRKLRSLQNTGALSFVSSTHHPSSSSSTAKSSSSVTLGDIITSGADERSDNDGPTVYVITPTFYRPEQKPELTRLAQALLPVHSFVHWIIVEDISQGSNVTFEDLEQFMTRFPKLKYTLLKSEPPSRTTRIVGRPRGVGGRRAALDWLRKTFQGKPNVKGVAYFADDDNTYDSSVFEQMQSTKKVSMWPVGLVTDFGVSSPIVQNGKVVGFYDGWSGKRKFPVDMAGFAISLQLFLNKPDANMPWVAGYEEDELLKSLGITIKDIQPLANNCTEILVWHTKAQRNDWPKRPKYMKPALVSSTNLLQLLKALPQKSLAGQGANFSRTEAGFSFLHMIFGGS